VILVGELSLWVALLMATWAATVSFAGGYQGRRDLIASGERGIYATLGMVVLASLGLWTAIFTHDFSFKYVASFTSANLPKAYLFTAFWAGQAGSLLFWCLVLSLFGALAQAVTSRRHDELMPYVAAVVNTVAAFFLLYLTEGIPAGFTNIAVATQMRRAGLSPAVIGAFVGALYLPWAVKWAFGPFVDVLSSERWGRRRGWILLTQMMMIATILVAMPVDFATRLGLFTAIVFVHNIFAATQDVAIDALACSVLRDDERGLANGLMFGGQYLGTALGGTGALFLASVAGFPVTFIAVSAAIALVTAVVAWPMREPPGPPRPPLGLRSLPGCERLAAWRK